MTMGLVGRKCGMTRVFTDEGISIPVTVIEIIANKVTQIKTQEIDGYTAIQISSGKQLAQRISKPQAGQYAKAGVEAGRSLTEFRVTPEEVADVQLGQEFTVETFKEGQVIDVRGVSRGKGFAGVVKRHNFGTQDATHGNSLSHRAPGSIGQCQFPGRVFKGKKMAGHMGAARCTVQNQKIVRVDVERNAILIKGAVPGAPSGEVIIFPSVKKQGDK